MNQTVPLVISGLVCALFVMAVPALALEFHVSPTGDDAAAGTVTKPFVNFFDDKDAKTEGAQATINKAGIEIEYRQ